MGLKDIFRNKKSKEDLKPPMNETLKKAACQEGFVLGVQNRFNLINSDNIVVVGKLSGTAHVGDAVYVSNMGDDNDSILVTTILGIEVGPRNRVQVHY